MKYMITGSSGFIASNFIKYLMNNFNCEILAIDKHEAQQNTRSVELSNKQAKFNFFCSDVGNKDLLSELLSDFSPDAVFHFAAETHVDTSIQDPLLFIQNNVTSFSIFLNEVRAFWSGCNTNKKEAFRFINISTDEVYGALLPCEPAFTEANPFKPNNPYSASKAAADCIVRSFFKTFDMPFITVHSANNFGPLQKPEKFIPLMIHKALNGIEIPIYGDGSNMRDWLYVEDNCMAIWAAYNKGVPGESYNIGAGQEISNNQVAAQVVRLLDEKVPRHDGLSYSELINFVEDRPGHDFRYSIDSGKAATQLGWKSSTSFQQGIEFTVCWYLDNQVWLADSWSKLNDV